VFYSRAEFITVLPVTMCTFLKSFEAPALLNLLYDKDICKLKSLLTTDILNSLLYLFISTKYTTPSVTRVISALY
jgi:hypothetical protein